MREILQRRGVAAHGLLAVVAASLVIGPATAQTVVRPGQTDVSVTVEIENEADSGADIASAQVTATSADPAVKNIRVSPAAPVPIGQVKSFTITFDVSDVIPETPDPYSFTVDALDVIQDAVDPDPETYLEKFIFSVGHGPIAEGIPPAPVPAGENVVPVGSAPDGVEVVDVTGPPGFGVKSSTYSPPESTLAVPLPCSIPGTYTVRFRDSLGRWSTPRSFDCLAGDGEAYLKINGNIVARAPGITREHLKGNLHITSQGQMCYPLAVPDDQVCKVAPELVSPAGTCVRNVVCRDALWYYKSPGDAASTGITVRLPAEFIGLDGQRTPNFMQDVRITAAVHEGPDWRGTGAVGPNLDFQHVERNVPPGGTISTASIHIPSMGQDQVRCTADNKSCVASKTGIPEITCRKPSGPESSAAQAQGLYPVCGYGEEDMVCDFAPSPAVHFPPLGWTARCPKPPPEVDITSAGPCLFARNAWICEAGATPDCGADGNCEWNAPLGRSSTWGLFARLPPELPDRRAPTLSGTQTSADGISWADAATTVFSTQAHARVSVQDLGFGVERVSGVKVSTDPGPAGLVPGSETLIHFDEGAGLLAAGLGNNLNLTGGTWVAGRHGSAIRLNGAGDQGFFTRNAAFDIDRFTLAAWIKPTVPNAGGAILANWGGEFRGFQLELIAGFPRVITGAQNPDAHYDVLNLEKLRVGEWNLVAATFDGAFLSLYIDGALKGRIPARLSRASTPKFGKSDAFITSFLPASIDGLRVIGRALSAEELLWDYRRGWSAQYSVNGGASWGAVPEGRLAYPGAVEATPGPYFLAAGPLGLPESQTANRVAFYAEDVAGNRSSATVTARTAVPGIDITPPVTNMAFTGAVSTDGTGGRAIATGTLVGLQAADLPGPGAPASGVAGTFFLVDGVFVDSNTTPLAPFVSPFSLTLGSTHVLRFHSVDQAGNQEPVRTERLTVDGAAPLIAIESPRSGDRYFAGSSSISIRFTITDDHDPAPFIEASLVQLEDRGSPRGALPASVPVFAGQVINPSAIDDGLWELRVSARDFVFNSTAAAGGAFEVVHDQQPPRTALIIGEPKFGTAPAVISTYTLLSFAAVDDLAQAGDGQGAGVKETLFFIDIDPLSCAGALPNPAAPRGTCANPFYAEPFTLGAGTHTLAYFSRDTAGHEETSRTAALAADDQAPVIAIQSPLAGERYVAGVSSIAARFTVTDNLDPVPFFTASLAQLEDRGSPRGALPALIAASTGQVFDPLSLDDGLWELRVLARDFVANGSSAAGGAFEVIHDTIPPVTAILIGEPRLGEGPVVVASSTLIGFAATDDISGVGETRYALDAEAFQAYSASFTISANGLHVIHWFSVDRANNREALHSSTVAVDAQAPALSLACPGPEGGACSVFKENVAVRGSVFDERLAQYKLESGSMLITSGTTNTDGVLGTWDLSALAGAQTLSLSAADLLGNAAALTRQVFIGEPARLLVFGSKKDLGQPQGVAVDNQRGVVYVANTNKNEIRLYTLAGAFIKAYEDFRHPRAVAVDENGNLYVAESGRDRIVKLDPLGTRLWTKGGLGRAPLEFRDPSGLAAGGGKVAVSDTRNRRVQVLSQDGDFLREFPIPEGAEPMLADDGEEDDEPGNRKGVPVGIALDAEGRIYVADAKNRRGLAFSPAGQLLKEFGGPALFARPEGITVSTSGECVFLSDRIKDNIRKFDATGQVTLTFGTQGNIKENKPLPVETVFRRPIGLALDAAGTLWVADRNNEVIQRFGLPGTLTAGGPPAGAAPGGLRTGSGQQEGGETTTSAPADFYLREAYAVPNPCKACGPQGFVAQVGLADWVGLECRNMMGRVVYQNPFGGPTIKDIGNGRGVQYTYEQLWPLSGVGTGVYACVVTARKSGKPEIRKVVRSAIIK